MTMPSKKRKAADEGEAVSDSSAQKRFTVSEPSPARDRYYSTLYANEINFHHLGKQDADFAAVYLSPNFTLFRSDFLTRR